MSPQPTGAMNSDPAPELLQSLGAWMLAWSSVDRTMETCTAMMFNISLVEATCITGAMTTLGKINMLSSRLHLDEPQGHPEGKENALDALKRLRKLNDNRNDLVHGTLIGVDTGDLYFLKAAAREKIGYRKRIWQREEIDDLTARVRKATSDLDTGMTEYTFEWHDITRMYQVPS